jgi:alpha-tubulin suppressor-like RCC1 family protein
MSSISCGWGHVLALTRSGKLFSWGSARHGQHGQGHAQNSCGPVVLEGRFKQIAAGSTHSMAISDDGRLFVHVVRPISSISSDTLL